MSTQDRLELAAQCLENIQQVRQWSDSAPVEVQVKAKATETQAQWVFQVLLTRFMRCE